MPSRSPKGAVRAVRAPGGGGGGGGRGGGPVNRNSSYGDAGTANTFFRKAIPYTAPRSSYGDAGTARTMLSRPNYTAPRRAGSYDIDPTGVFDYDTSGMGGGALAGMAPAVDYSKMSDQALGGYDSAFGMQLAALNAALSGQLDDFKGRRSDYDTNMAGALKQLGISGQVFDDPATKDVDEQVGGQWDWRDLNTTSGRGNYNQRNDFASRGVLQSSMYADANKNLSRALADQVAGVGDSRTSFLNDLARQQAAAEMENKNAIANAKQEALMRLASGIGL